jgi:hypothetical protein
MLLFLMTFPNAPPDWFDERRAEASNETDVIAKPKTIVAILLLSIVISFLTSLALKILIRPEQKINF